MSKKCGSCGTPAPDNSAVFCNRCGARLPADDAAYILTCRKCGKTITDRQSQFCDRCGSPLAPVAQAVQAIRPEQPVQQVQPVKAEPLAVPAVKGTICRSCGFENPGENRFYCKKCGAYMPKKETLQKYGLPDDASDRRLKEGSIRIRPDGMDALRQKPAYKPVEAPVQSRTRRHKAPKKKSLESYRNVALGAAGLIILIVIFIAVIAPGILNAGSGNETASRVKAPGCSMRSHLEVRLALRRSPTRQHRWSPIHLPSHERGHFPIHRFLFFKIPAQRSPESMFFPIVYIRVQERI